MVTRRVFASFALGALLAGLGVADSGASLPTKEAGKVVASGAVAPSAPELKSLGVRSFAPAPKSSPTEILFQNGIRFQTTQGEPDLPRGLRMNEVTDGDERIGLLVQVEAPCRQEWIGLLERAGAKIQFYVPNYAFLVRVQAKDRKAIEALPFVTWTGLYHPAYRISGQTAMSSRTGRGEYQALLFDDGDLADVIRQIQFLGGEIEDSSDNGINKIVRFKVDRVRMEQVAAHNDVQWIEPREHFTTDNSSVQWVDMTFVSNDRKVWDKGITGTGQVVMVGDSGIRTTHNNFRDALVPITNFGDFPTHRKIIAYIKSTPAYTDIVFGDTFSGHGTHTSGTFAGDDSPFGADLRDGVAKGAKIYFSDCGGSDAQAVITPGDLNDYFGPAYAGNAGGAARVSSNSWGADTQGAYTTTSMTADQFARSHPDFTISFSNGNA
ncbi:MAG TPA: S8 family serine peptidase, partial [bacterium]|nr:S8 family serine peptidase [bacterium]